MLSYMIKTQQLKVFSNPHLSAQTVLTSRTKGQGCLLHLLYHKHYVHNQNLKIAILTDRVKKYRRCKTLA